MNLKNIINNENLLNELFARDSSLKNLVSGYKSNMGNNVPRVAIVGLQNSGKSTLANVLVNSLDLSVFPTADNICTRESSQHEYKHVIYIDTPGLGTIYDNDDNQSVESWYKADLILYVHSFKTGGLHNRDEVALLERIRDALGQKAAQRIVCVLTKTETAESEELNSVFSEMNSRLFEIFNYGIDIVSISSTSFIQAQKFEEKELREELETISNIANVQDLIKTKISQGYRSDYESTIIEKITAIVETIEAEKIEIKNLISLIEQDQKKKISLFKEEWNSHKDKISMAHAEVLKLKKELGN